MFTGIVEEIGTVQQIHHTQHGYALKIACTDVLEDTRTGDSIAVNGVCLTVTTLSNTSLTVGLAPETRARTNLTYLRLGSQVNLERAITLTTRMGGHFVQGHIDETGHVIGKRTDEDALWITIGATPSLLRYVVPKGCIALDGTSLTVVSVGQDWFDVTIIAYTQQHTILPQQSPGYSVNIEVDILGKYVEKLIMHSQNQQSSITFDKLVEYGFV
jgi:riboflavin synthase